MRHRIIHIGALLVAICLSPACEAMSTPAGQQVTGVLLSIVARQAAAKLAERGLEPDVDGAVCINADELDDGNDVPMVVCIVPGRLPE